ncbi:hypothetical protein C8R46DRAFT_375565 [Mycena filopes]|nr:hypothetical protein C8R46DRAFT_375565 [Mycena filopes]
MASSSSRSVAVFGATGLQGSAVVNRLLADGTFTPRAITRDVNSAPALKLKERGVEVVQADRGDKASLVNALRGSEAVFAMTSPGKTSEVTQGQTMIDAAKEAGVKFFLFSSLPSLKELSGGKYNVPSFDEKAEIEVYLKSSGLPSASLLLGGFAENFWTRNFLKKTPTGFNITLPKYSPETVTAFTWIERDLGEAALAVLKSYADPTKNVLGRAYPVVTAQLTYPALAAMTAEALGVEVTFTSIPSSGIPPLDELCEARSQYELYAATPVPNPDLVALGAKFGTMEEFMEMEVKKRYG